MAFCKYCGKEIPEGGSCSCPGAIHEEQANRSYDDKKQIFDDQTEEPIEDITGEFTADAAETDDTGISEQDIIVRDALNAAKEAAAGIKVPENTHCSCHGTQKQKGPAFLWDFIVFCSVFCNSIQDCNKRNYKGYAVSEKSFLNKRYIAAQAYKKRHKGKTECRNKN